MKALAETETQTWQRVGDLLETERQIAWVYAGALEILSLYRHRQPVLLRRNRA